MNATIQGATIEREASENRAAPAVAPNPAPVPVPGSDRRELWPFHLDAVATVALAAYSGVVATGFARVFSGWSFLRDLLLLVVVGHGGSFVLRRLRMSGWLAVPTMLLASVWVMLARQYWTTFEWFMPSGETWRRVQLQLDLVQEQFQTAVAPVIYDIGWALIAGLAMVMVVALADAFAFRADARGESLVPGMVLFIFVAALGSPRLRIAPTAAMVFTGVLAVIALRALHNRRRHVTLTAGGDHRPPTFLMASLATGVVIAVVAGVVGPRLPGADDEPLFETRGRGDRTTRVISPLVDIRSRLTNTSNVELFRVLADQPAYWRVTTLGDFDGVTFGLPTRRLGEVDPLEPESDARVIRQRVQVIGGLGQLIPSAADPYQAAGESADGTNLPLRLDRDTNSLLAPEELAPGDLFTIVSATPVLDPDRLRRAGVGTIVDPVYLGLPEDLPAVVPRLASEVTAGAPTTYDQAMALQTWFRNEFSYSLEVQQGHSDDAIEAFLDIRVGYCEQFSATFAAMARTLGIPSRVAVGYTPGELTGDGWYSVRGKNAHAWPELFFRDVGWVAFEPTPGRGAPGAESYTRLDAQQDDSSPANPPNLTPGNTVAAPPTVPAAIPDGDEASVTSTTLAIGTPNQVDGPDTGAQAGAANPVDSGGGMPWTWLLILAIGAILVALPWAIRRMQVRITHGYAPAERVFASWSRACRAAIRAGVHGADSMTATQWASATATQLPVAARPMGSLAKVVDAVVYGKPGSVDLDQVGSFGKTIGHDCDLWAAQIERIAVDRLTTWQRVQRYFTDIKFSYRDDAGGRCRQAMR